MSTIATNAMENLIIKACGARSMTEYAKACGVSPMHISRIRSGICKPSKKMCIKLGSEPYVRRIGLTTKDFLKAAGYDDNAEIESVQKYENDTNSRINTVVIGSISKSLLDQGFSCQLSSLEDTSDVDFKIKIFGSNIDLLYVCMMVQEKTADLSHDRFFYYYMIGRLSTLPPREDIQYVMIMSDATVFDQLQKGIENAVVRANVTLVLLNPKQVIFSKEVHFGPSKNYISLI